MQYGRRFIDHLPTIYRRQIWWLSGDSFVRSTLPGDSVSPFFLSSDCLPKILNRFSHPLAAHAHKYTNENLFMWFIFVYLLYAVILIILLEKISNGNLIIKWMIIVIKSHLVFRLVVNHAAHAHSASRPVHSIFQTRDTRRQIKWRTPFFTRNSRVTIDCVQFEAN